MFSRGPAEFHPEAPTLRVTALAGSSLQTVARSAEREVLAWHPDTVVIQYVPQMWGATRFGSLAVPLLCRAMRRQGIRVVVFAHELMLSWAWRPDLALGAALNRIQLAWLLRESDRFIVTTESRLRATTVLARALDRESHLAFVPVGPGARPIPASPSPARFDLGTFSSRTPNKNFDVILDAFAAIAERVPVSRLHLIGDPGNARSAYARHLDARIREHPAADRIRVTGSLPLADVSRAVSQLDVFLFTMDVGATTRSSTLPVALGAGVPVVAFRGADTGSLFVPDSNIVFASELTGPSFADAVLRVHDDTALRGRVVAGGRLLFEEMLSWDAIGRRMRELLLVV